MKSQSEATIDITVNYCNEKNLAATPFETDYSTVLDANDKKVIVSMVLEGLKNGSIGMTHASKQKFMHDEKGLKKYAVGLVNDRLRKAKALNGNVAYKCKEPGKLSRDPQLKALNQILKLETTREEDKLAIEAAITKRKAEIAATKAATKAAAKAPKVNYDDLPMELRAKLRV